MKAWLSEASTVSTASNTTLTIDDIKRSIDVINSLPPEPFRQWMIESGKPPEDGYELHLPFHLKTQFPFAPEYVKFSRAVHKPIIAAAFNIRTIKYDPRNC